MEWTTYFISIARVVALKSKDPSTKIGAVIVGPKDEIRTTGYNGFPRFIADDEERWADKDVKYGFVEHAERNAIYNAARCGIKTEECAIYMTAPPCRECARAIIQAGIREVYYPENHPFREREDWAESLAFAKNLLFEAGIYFREVRDEELL